MTRWSWWCAMALVSGLWVARVASAADQEALFTEGTLTSVDLTQDPPSITLRRSTGQPLILQLGRIGAWESLKVGAAVKLRYTEQGGVSTVESMQIVPPVQAAASAPPAASPSPSPSATATPPRPADTQHEQATTDKQEKKPGKKKP